MADPTIANSQTQRDEAQRQLARQNLMTGLGAGFKALGSIASGVSSYRTSVARAAVYQSNAALLRASIPQVQKEYDQKVDIIRQETGQFIANQRAAMAANGIVVDQDTGLEAMVQTAGIGARQVVEALQAARQEVANIQNKANMQDFEARLAKRQGKGDAIRGVFGAAETILGAAQTISAANQRYKTATGG